MGSRFTTAFAHFDRAELRFCRYLNRSSGLPTPRAFFHAISRVGILAHKLIKCHAVRERPFITHPAINCAAAPLDRYSFPSGHTLHAVCFALLGGGLAFASLEIATTIVS